MRSSIGRGHLFSRAWNLVLLLVGRSAEQGAQTTLHCVVTSERINGRYYSNCGEAWKRFTTPYVEDEELVRISYQKTKAMMKAKCPETHLMLAP